jgi:hypothetical protein
MHCHLLNFAALVLICASVRAQSLPSGGACGCPDVAARDTVWVTDNSGAGVGSATWTCDHLYVLTEQVFVNAEDTLSIEPGTVVLGMSGQGMTQIDLPTNIGIGSVREVTYDVYPGALVVARGAYLDAQGTSDCPIQFSFVGDPMDGSVGVDVTGQWGGVVLCGGAQTNTLHLDLGFFTAPFFTTGVGTGEDRAEGIVDLSGQDREVYGGNADPDGSSGTLRYVSIRHGSTNLGWTQFGNGNETDLLQLGACGLGTVVEHIELIGSADDGLHILGGLVQVRHVLSAFHAEDAFESDQGWQGSAQYLLGVQDTALAHATNPPGPSFVYDAEGDDVQDNNMDPSSEPYCLPEMANFTFITNGAEQAASYHSLPGGDWLNSVVHGVSDAGIEVQHYLTCDGFNAMLATQYAFLSIRNWRIWGDESSQENVLRGRYKGNYGAQEAMEGWLTDSANVVESVLVDGAFHVVNGQITDGLDPRASAGGTVSSYYLPTDPRLDAVTYHGALEPGANPWFAGWSYFANTGGYSGEAVVEAGLGCTYASACNYDPEAAGDDGSCDFTSCAGCTYAWACNYDATAVLDDGSCERESCGGCTFVLACNYDPSATQDDGSCTYEECSGCTWTGAPNYDPTALIDDGSCIFEVTQPCYGDLNEDGVVSTLDLLDFLSVYGSYCGD